MSEYNNGIKDDNKDRDKMKAVSMKNKILPNIQYSEDKKSELMSIRDNKLRNKDNNIENDEKIISKSVIQYKDINRELINNEEHYINNKENNKNKNNNIKNNNNIQCNKYIFHKIGLENLGMTCFINSVLQCITHIEELYLYFTNEYPNKKSNLKKINKESETKGELSSSLYEIFSSIYEINNNNNNNNRKDKEYSVINPLHLKQVLESFDKNIKSFEPNDARDLLLLLLPNLEDELNELEKREIYKAPTQTSILNDEIESFNHYNEYFKANRKSIISKLFEYVTGVNYICKECHQNDSNYKGTFQFKIQIILFIPLRQFYESNLSCLELEKGLEKYFSSSESQLYCDKCNKLTNVYELNKIYIPPKILIINLERGKNKMFDMNVKFKEHLDLSKYCYSGTMISTNYKLKGVVTHYGKSGNIGHYIAYCKNDENDKWYAFSDSIYRKCKSSDISTGSPYILFYQRLDNIEDIPFYRTFSKNLNNLNN